MTNITIYSAKKIITMNRYQPTATHVAVREGRVLGVGSLDKLSRWGDYTLDQRFQHHVITPGFVEGHCHAMEGAVWDHAYVGYHDRYDPEGRLWKGATSLEAVVEILQKAEKALSDPEQTLFAWGFDPIFFNNERMGLQHIDHISSTRPISILHSNAHLLNVNSVVLQRAGLDRGSNVFGVIKDTHGNPTGELKEMAAKYMAYKVTGNPFLEGSTSNTLKRFAKSATNAGVTTATDLFASLSEESIATYLEASQDNAFSIRLLPAMNTLDVPPSEGIQRVQNAIKRNTDKIKFGLCKVMTDGSIQGFSGRLKWPGYFNGAENGLWNMPPEQLIELVNQYHKSGLQLHIHTNGDEAIELMIDAIDQAMSEYPKKNHRHTLQHCQMADEAHFRRMHELGICANLFANHIYYWGDQHYALTMGPDRAMRMNACATAQAYNVPFAIHSDAPVTPLAPLFTAWCAINRITQSGRKLGSNERISVDSALHAITLGAAYTIKMDHLVGSIDVGKFADFTVLEHDPYEVDPIDIKDIGIVATVLGGKCFETAKRTPHN